jgi:hypothetical protein
MKPQFPEAVSAIRRWVASRKLGPGSRLPSTRRLGEEIGFSRLTTGLACHILVATGELYRQGYQLYYGTRAATRPPVAG